MSDPQVSAIVCTHNRDDYLGVALDSLLEQDFRGVYEVIVVDNRSSDRTAEVVAARQPNPRLQYVYEPELGLSVARNTGARLARGSVLAYLDDDAIASSQWLRTLYDAYQQNDRLAIAGGKVTLIWANQTPPGWLSANLAGNLGAYDLGDQVCLIHSPGLTPRGVNYSLRKVFWEQVEGFNPELGRVGTRLLSNEELYMTELALRHGWQVAYLPTATVAHHIAPERLHRSWFLQRSWWQGISECTREQLTGQTGLRQLWHGGERLLRGLYRSLKYINDPAASFDNVVYAYGQVGYIFTAVQVLLWRSHWVKPFSGI